MLALNFNCPEENAIYSLFKLNSTWETIVKFHSRSLTFVLSAMGKFYNGPLMSKINILRTFERK